MTVIIQCFGITSEICAQDAIEGLPGTSVEAMLEAGTTIGELTQWLRNKYPALNELRHFFIARNQRQAKDDEVILATDELVIIPPVAGG